ncbi:MAG: hypothetical protein Q6367_017070 [Candidatus Freyarchaeota archaeon]
MIELKNIHLTLIPAFFIGELTKYFLNEKKLSNLYLISWLWGFILVGQVKSRFALKTPAQIYSLGMELGEAMGIGLYKTHDYIPSRYTHFIISNNPYIPYITNLEKKEPLDYFIAGCMGGGGCHVHNQICQNIELKCMLKGDNVCEFLTGTEKELRDRGLWEEVFQRYNLEKIYPLQKKFYENYSEGNEAKLMDEVIKEIL